jgi:putative transposase
MQLAESHLIKINNPFYKECDSLCFASKNLYNSSLYTIRREYLLNKNNVLFNLYHLMKTSDQYKALPAKVSASILISVNLNFKAFFASLDSYKNNPSKFRGRPQLPKYLDKETGRHFVSYTNQAISKKVFKKTQRIKLSQSNIEFKTGIEDFSSIDCVRIIPHLNYFTIEVVYTVPDVPLQADNQRYASIDLGLNNLAAITSNIKSVKPIVFNGRPLKSINQYYNKKKAKLQSILKTRNKKNTSKKLRKLELDRKNKVDYQLHKTSKEIVTHCKSNNLNTIVIGKNKGWKNEINIGKRNNQAFTNIPHSRFIQLIKYKCEKQGINVIEQEESYTSKASFIDQDFIPTFKKNQKNEIKFSGNRIKRGLYKSLNGNLINADVNGSYNILRKAIPNAFADGIEGVGVHPKVITLK